MEVVDTANIDQQIKVVFVAQTAQYLMGAAPIEPDPNLPTEFVPNAPIRQNAARP